MARLEAGIDEHGELGDYTALDRALDAGQRLLKRRTRLVDDDLAQDRALCAGQAVLLRTLEREQIEAGTLRLPRVLHADRHIQGGMKVVAGVELLDGDR